MKIKTEKTC